MVSSHAECRLDIADLYTVLTKSHNQHFHYRQITLLGVSYHMG